MLIYLSHDSPLSITVYCKLWLILIMYYEYMYMNYLIYNLIGLIHRGYFNYYWYTGVIKPTYNINLYPLYRKVLCGLINISRSNLGLSRIFVPRPAGSATKEFHFK